MSRWILSVTGLVLILAGAGLVFLPQELAAALGSVSSAGVPVLAQLLGCAVMALGFIDWNSRANMMGGIYGRPLAMGNFFFFAVGAISVGKAISHLPGFAVGVVVVLAVFAVGFGWILFLADPVKDREKARGNRE